MTPETKKRAQEKLAELHHEDRLPGQVEGLLRHSRSKRDDLDRQREARRRPGSGTTRSIGSTSRWTAREWGMMPQEVNAYYNPLNNEIVFPAAILLPPFFDPNADAAVNYGAIGSVIGHEIGHGFDDQGRKFGPDGSLTDWWTEKDDKAFTARTQSLIKQYSGFEALPGLNIKGENTIGENIGDLGGLNIAYEAYQISLHGQEITGDRRAHRRATLLPRLGAGVAREVSRRHDA